MRADGLRDVRAAEVTAERLAALNRAIAMHRGAKNLEGGPEWYIPDGPRGRPALGDAKVIGAGYLFGAPGAARQHGRPSLFYSTDPRLWTRLLVEMQGNVAHYSLREIGDTWGASSRERFAEIQPGATPGEAVCRAYAKLHGLEVK